ncbi:MAG: hypothetical protein AAGA83_01460, partial [Cyanobacteria bacterium P01_F01_bin.116]
KKLVFSAFASTVFLLGCQAETPVKSTAPAEISTSSTEQPVLQADASGSAANEETGIIEVAVFRDGRVEIDGNKLDLEAAIVTLKATSDETVYYYREAPQEEPHPNAMKLIEAVIESGLSLTFSSEPDFSTVVTPDGEILPRN